MYIKWHSYTLRKECLREIHVTVHCLIDLSTVLPLNLFLSSATTTNPESNQLLVQPNFTSDIA